MASGALALRLKGTSQSLPVKGREGQRFWGLAAPQTVCHVTSVDEMNSQHGNLLSSVHLGSPACSDLMLGTLSPVMSLVILSTKSIRELQVFVIHSLACIDALLLCKACGNLGFVSKSNPRAPGNRIREKIT
jgi:hypothetical protein